MTAQIFEGIRVIDLCQGMAGSVVTMILADFGAEVIRLEPPGGDPMWQHPAYLLWQRGKQSVALDWDSAEGREQARRLIEGADIFIETLRPGAAESLGLGYEVLRAANPALIYHSLAPFGQTGPYRFRPGYGTVAEAFSGFAHITGEADGPAGGSGEVRQLPGQAVPGAAGGPDQHRI
mgnify:CR=1 FL=1